MLNIKVGIPNANLFTNHCWREYMVSKLSNNPTVSLAETMTFARHTNANSHRHYVRPSDISARAFQDAVSGSPRHTYRETRNRCKQKAESRRIRDQAVKNIKKGLSDNCNKPKEQVEDDGGNDSEEYVEDNTNLMTERRLTRTMATRASTTAAKRPVRTSTRIAARKKKKN